MPALGDRAIVRFDEIEKTLRAYIIFQQYPKNPKISQNQYISKKINPKSHKILIRLNLISSNIIHKFPKK